MQVSAVTVAADDEPRVMAAPGLPHDEALQYAVIDGCETGTSLLWLI